MDLHLSDDQIFRVDGRFDNRVNYGNLCVKGRFGYDFVHAPDRLTAPLVRDARTDSFKEAAWSTTLMSVAGRLMDLRAEHGPDSIAFLASAKCTNEENYLMQKLARAVVGTNNIDHCARL
jgi:predicted molibdopterin-dependent oxidoreductase YjgC